MGMLKTLGKFISVLLLAAATVSGCAVVPLNQPLDTGSSGGDGSGSFSPTGYVTKNWSTKVIPYMDKNAADIQTVIKLYKSSPSKAQKKYGTEENGNGWVYIVKGTGKITGVHMQSERGLVDVKTGSDTFQMQVGPVIQGTSVRDSIKFISFDQVQNQIQFAQLSDAFNKKINDSVLSPFKFKQMNNETIQFEGVLENDSGQFVLTPVEISKG